MFRIVHTLFLSFILFVTAPNNQMIFDVLSISSAAAQEATPTATPINSLGIDTSATENLDVSVDASMYTTQELVLRSVNERAIFSLLTMFVIAVVAMAMLKCRGAGLQMDVLVFAAGALAFITGEVMAYTQHKKLAEDVSLDYDVMGLTDQQRRALEQQKELYEKSKSTANTKMMFQIAAVAAFGIAASIAIYRWFKLRSVYAAAKKFNTAKAGQCEEPVAALAEAMKANANLDKMLAVCLSAGSSTCAAENIECNMDATEARVCAEKTIPACAGDLAIAMSTDRATADFKSCTVVCGAEICGTPNLEAAPAPVAVLNDTLSYTPLLASSANTQVLTQKLFSVEENVASDELLSSLLNLPKRELSKVVEEEEFISVASCEEVDMTSFGEYLSASAKDVFLNLVSPAYAEDAVEASTTSEESADAEEGKKKKSSAQMYRLLGFGALAVGIVLGLIPKFGVAVAKFVYCPKGRAMFYAFAAGLAMGTVMETKKVITEIESHITTIESLLEALPSNTETIAKESVTATPEAEETIAVEAPTPVPTESKEVSGGSFVAGKDYPNASIYTGQSFCVKDANGNCVSLEKAGELAEKGFNGGELSIKGLGSDFGSLITKALKMGDGLQNTDMISVGTMSLVSELAERNAAVGKFFNDTLSAYNKDAVQKGEAALNLKEEASKAGLGFVDSARSYITSQGIDTKALAKEFGLSTSDSEAPSFESFLNTSGETSYTTSASSGYGTGTGVKSNATTQADTGLRLDYSTPHEYFGTYKPSFEDEVRGDNSTTIFQIITARYIKSALRRLGLISSEGIVNPETKQEAKQKTK